MSETRILIVEDESIIALDISNIIKSLGYSVAGVSRSGEDCLEMIPKNPPDIILMDIRLYGKMNGIETADEIRKSFGLPVVFLTAHADNNLLEDAKRAEPYGYILKPVNKSDLHSAIEVALYKYRIDSKLKESEEMLRKAEGIANIGTFKYDIREKRFFYSDEMLRIFGLEPVEFTGDVEQVFGLIHEEDRPEVAEQAAVFFETGKPYEIEFRIVHKNGNVIHVNSMGEFVYDKNGTVTDVIGTSQDITDRRISEQRIKQLNRLLLAIRNINKLIIHEKDVEKLINGACENLFNTGIYSSAWIALYAGENDFLTAAEMRHDYEASVSLKEKLKNLASPPCIKKVLRHSGILIAEQSGDYCGKCGFAEEHCGTVNIVVRLKYNKKIYGALSVQFESGVSAQQEELTLLQELADDIAFALNSIELENTHDQLQKQLIYSEKLSAVGQLAAGVAHEFNNFLNVIIGRTQLSLEEDSIEEIKESLIIIKDMSWRGSDLVKNLSAFARPKEPKLKEYDITELMDQVIKLQKRQLELENIKVIRQYTGELKTSFDWGQLEQVFFNLFINATHALKPKGGGTITVEIQNENGHIVIKFSDTGTGMDKDTSEKIFDPFFTTKISNNESEITGSGLGLSVSNTIISSHGGTIAVQSEKGKGTVFTISLPQITTGPAVKDSIPAEVLSEGTESFRDMRILIVDDEQEMVDLMRVVFNKCGFSNVVIKDRGEDALSIAKFFNPDLVFLDLGMPDMDGETVFNELRLINSRVPVIFMSGRLNVDENRFTGMGAYDFLHKPFEVKSIFDIIKKIGSEGNRINPH